MGKGDISSAMHENRWQSTAHMDTKSVAYTFDDLTAALKRFGMCKEKNIPYARETIFKVIDWLVGLFLNQHKGCFKQLHLFKDKFKGLLDLVPKTTGADSPQHNLLTTTRFFSHIKTLEWMALLSKEFHDSGGLLRVFEKKLDDTDVDIVAK